MEILVDLCAVYGIMLLLYLPHKGSGHSALWFLPICHKLVTSSARGRGPMPEG